MTKTDLAYLAGLTDGEGHFGFTVEAKPRGRSVKCQFVINLRDDDRPVLDWVQRTLGCGTIYSCRRRKDNPLARFAVYRIDECEQLADLFSRAPLRSKKKRELRIWTRAIQIACTLQKGGRANGCVNDRIWSRLEHCAKALRNARVYRNTHGP